VLDISAPKEYILNIINLVPKYFLLTVRRGLSIMAKNTEESKSDQLRRLLHNCNKYVFFHVGKGAQQNKAISLLLDGPMSQKELQEKLGVQPASVSELISKLETKGLVERTRSESDRRVVMLSLTKEGMKREKTTNEIRSTEELFVCLDDEEKDQLISLLEKLDQSFSGNER